MCACTRWLYTSSSSSCRGLHVARERDRPSIDWINSRKCSFLFFFLPLRSCTSETCGMICTMSPGTRAYKHKRRESPSCVEPERRGGGPERNKKKMDGLSNVYWKTLVRAGSHRVDVAFRRDGTAKSREGNGVASPSRFLLLLLPLRTFPTATKWGWTSPQLEKKKIVRH